MDIGRKHDLEQLRRDYAATRDPKVRRQIDDAGKRIMREGKKIQSMREALIREHRRGGTRGTENVRDIHESVEKDNKYEYRHPKPGY